MNCRSLGLLAAFFVAAGWVCAQGPTTAPTTAPPGTIVLPNGGATFPATPAFNGGPSAIPDGAFGPGSGDPVFFGSADYLLWQIRKGRLPSTAMMVPVGVIAFDTSDTVTTSPTGTPTFPGTQSRGYAPASIQNQASFGAGPFTDLGSQNGGRFGLGFWLDEDQSFGMEAGFFFLERGSDRFAAISAQSPNQFIIRTDFTTTLFLIGAGGERTPLRSFDVFVVREAASSLTGVASATLYGGEINSRATFLRVGGFDFGGLTGFRYLNFKDELAIFSNIFLRQPAGIAPTSTDTDASLSRNLTFATRDRTRVWNHFYGGQVGIDVDGKFGAFFINTRAKFAFGNMHQVAQVESFTDIINADAIPGAAPGTPHQSPPSSTTGGGLLGSPGDNGRHTRDRFAFIPEVNVKFGYQFASWLRGYIGYDGLYLGHVARAGSSSVINTLNTTVQVANSTQNINVAQPTFRFRDQDVWVQGVSFGLEARY
jgi:hypothetical protein